MRECTSTMKQTLYLKTHNVTKKKYLGQTTRDPFVYKGSGTHWTRHLEKHGNDVTTEILFESTDKELFEATAKSYSKKLDVVNSSEFLNLVEEHGGSLGAKANPNYKDGALVGQYDNPLIRKRVDKVRNAQRHAEHKVGNRHRMLARYYLNKDLNKAKEHFDAWQDYKKSMPPSTKGNYKRKFESWNDWKSKQKFNQ